MPIALLKFPTDLLREVFQQCDPFELYKLSKCSKRIQKSIRSGGTKNWKLIFRGNLVIVSVDGLHYNFDVTENPDEYFKTENPRGYENYITIPFDDNFDAFLDLLDTFRIRIVEYLRIEFGSFEQFSKLARGLIERNIEIEEVLIESTPQVKKVDKLMTLLTQMNTTQKFKCLKKFPPKFRHQMDKFPKNILIYSSFWFTIDQLLESTCVRIELHGSMLKNQDIDLFFQKWKRSGSFPNLRWLEIFSKNIDDKSPILGMIPPIENYGNRSIS
ncbi:hypothetical protein B9Z55_003679 [Caenorhabditis nigoni]|uniref:F-box domain-containing protein n=1 Tax=Caenorhabditis nigoni TaxID=1611254 RepID=A0A2G5VS08_9PELO|nr:hypothetical protein B9Z55_003679 [Caenorhabditis nigoni]